MIGGHVNWLRAVSQRGRTTIYHGMISLVAKLNIIFGKPQIPEVLARPLRRYITGHFRYAFVAAHTIFSGY